MLAHFINVYTRNALQHWCITIGMAPQWGWEMTRIKVQVQPGPGHTQVAQICDRDCSKHADLPIPADQ